MVINLRSAVGMAAIWLAAVTGVSATAWVAVDRAGRDISDASGGVRAAVSLNTPTLASKPTATPAGSRPTITPSPAALPAPRATWTPTPAPLPAVTAKPTALPTAAATSPPARPAPPPAPAAQDKTISVSGGIVAVRCLGATIALRTAQPENDWQVRVDTFGGDQIAVTFLAVEEGTTIRTQVTAGCTNGTPTFTVTDS